MSSKSKKSGLELILGLVFEVLGRFGHWFFMTFIPAVSRFIWRQAFAFSTFLVNVIESKMNSPFNPQAKEATRYFFSIVLCMLILLIVSLFL